jgi:transposase
MTKVTQNLNFEGSTIYVGMDVHLKSWNISIYCNNLYLKSFNQPPSPQALRDYLVKNYPNAKYKCAYEAGFCGFWVQRQLSNFAIDCILVNASDVPQTDKSNKTKNDKNDSIRIAKALQAGLLVANHIPDKELEADRSLVRCYEKYNKDLRRAKSRTKGLLYQIGIELPEQFQSNNWSGKFIQWLKELKFDDISIKYTLDYNITTVEFIKKQKLKVLKDIRLLLSKERYFTVGKNLMSIPDIGQLTGDG